MNTEVDPEQMNKTHWTSQTNEQYACSVFVCSLPTLGASSHSGLRWKCQACAYRLPVQALYLQSFDCSRKPLQHPAVYTPFDHQMLDALKDYPGFFRVVTIALSHFMLSFPVKVTV